MALADYHLCDQCRSSKTFYDANTNFEFNKDGTITYDNGHKVYALCHTCSENYAIKIVRKD